MHSDQPTDNAIHFRFSLQQRHSDTDAHALANTIKWAEIKETTVYSYVIFPSW